MIILFIISSALIIILGFFLAGYKNKLEEKENLINILKEEGDRESEIFGIQIATLDQEIKDIQNERQQFIQTVQNNAEEQYRKWKESELISAQEIAKKNAIDEANLKLDSHIKQFETEIRADAIKSSKAVSKGFHYEELIPILKDSPYNAGDFRHLGSPIDYLIFSGLSEESGEITIIFCEVKTGKAVLNKREKRVRDAVENKRIEYIELREKI